MSEGWIFTPDTGATSDVADYDYLHYGFWLMKDDRRRRRDTYNEVETFADASVDPTARAERRSIVVRGRVRRRRGWACM